MFDLGANFGYYSIRVAAALRGDCSIYAFEPNPNTMLRLRRNLELNSVVGVYPIEKGLADVAGRAIVVEKGGHAGAASLRQV